jgi:hypothetical protein
MLKTLRVLAVAAVAAPGAACGDEQAAQPVQTEVLPVAAGAAPSACALRPVRYVHGKLEDKFLIGGGPGEPLKREAVFAKRRIQINTDGAPNSYHGDAISADDPSVGAINIICNSGTKLYESGLWSYLKSLFVAPESLKCYGKSGISVDPRYAEIYKSVKANDWSPAQGYRIQFNWDILAKKEAPEASWFASLFARDRPCITDDGFFVSKTKLGHHAPKQSCDPSAWLDANEVKGFVLPQHWLADWTSPRAARWASFQPGDVVVAYRPAEGTEPETWVYGIVGDAGPIYKLGEATLAFNWPLHRKTGNIRAEIRTYRQAVGLDTDMLSPQEIPLLVLEGSAPALGGDYSPESIETKAREVFAKWGGEERFKACLAAFD